MTTILVVEDEEHIAAGLRFNLEAEGYDVALADSGEKALKLLERRSVDLILLDVMLPGVGGFEVARRLRGTGVFTPILMLTARGQAEDILEGLQAGADDYVPKPFDLSILLARIQGLLRRKQWHEKASLSASKSETYRIDSKLVDFEAQEIRSEDGVQPLTVMEADLLRYLIRSEGKVVPRKALLEEVWGVREDTDTRAVDNFIVRLRKYLEPDPSKPRHLLTVRGLGYRFIANPD